MWIFANRETANAVMENRPADVARLPSNSVAAVSHSSMTRQHSRGGEQDQRHC